MLMLLPVAAMRVEDRDGAPPERLAPDLTIKVIQALRPASHQRAQQDRGVVIEGRAEHGWDCENDMAIDAPLVERLAHLADPIVHGDLGTPQAQGRFAAHRHQMLALSTVQAAVFEGTHLFRVATRQHLGHQVIIVGRLVARMGACKPVPSPMAPAVFSACTTPPQPAFWSACDG
jgi:hypothetical protein